MLILHVQALQLDASAQDVIMLAQLGHICRTIHLRFWPYACPTNTLVHSFLQWMQVTIGGDVDVAKPLTGNSSTTALAAASTSAATAATLAAAAAAFLQWMQVTTFLHWMQVTISGDGVDAATTVLDTVSAAAASAATLAASAAALAASASADAMADAMISFSADSASELGVMATFSSDYSKETIWDLYRQYVRTIYSVSKTRFMV